MNKVIATDGLRTREDVPLECWHVAEMDTYAGPLSWCATCAEWVISPIPWVEMFK